MSVSISTFSLGIFMCLIHIYDQRTSYTACLLTRHVMKLVAFSVQ